MLDTIKDTQKSWSIEAHLSALPLTLTLQDIGGEIAYQDRRRNGKRYATWFDGHVREQALNGEVIRKLRRTFLHEGSIRDISNTDSFELHVSESKTSGVYGISVYSSSKVNDSPYQPGKKVLYPRFS